MIYLHIGLPKTATSYLQSQYFPLFRSRELVVNPPEIIYPLLKALPTRRTTGTTQDEVHESKYQIRDFISENDRKILLSHESMSTDGYCPYYFENLLFLRELFDDAKIIVSIRNQYDWCIAMYKQSVHQGNVQSPKTFFDCTKKAVKATRNYWENVNSEMPKLDVYAIDWPGMIQSYKQYFGSANVYVFVYERLLLDPNAEKEKLSEVFNVAPVKEGASVLYRDASKLSNREFFEKYGETREKFVRERSNKSMSMLGIQCSRFYYKIKRSLGLDMPYKASPAIGTEKNNLLYKFKVFNSWWFWRELWQRKIDKILYVDWDPIPSTNWSVDTTEYFITQNRQLAKLLKFEKLTDEYYSLGGRVKKN